MFYYVSVMSVYFPPRLLVLLELDLLLEDLGALLRLVLRVDDDLFEDLLDRETPELLLEVLLLLFQELLLELELLLLLRP